MVPGLNHTVPGLTHTIPWFTHRVNVEGDGVGNHKDDIHNEQHHDEVPVHARPAAVVPHVVENKLQAGRQGFRGQGFRVVPVTG